MKRLVVVGIVLGALVLPATAGAFSYFLPFGLANRESAAFSRELCEEEAECTAWGNHCRRVTRSRVDCLITGLSPGVYHGEEIACNTILHWGVSRSGYIRLKRYGETNCSPA